ncbi:hypothetical protein Pint_25270 [Pistacia integerrima]|uniref:Uncharacterized protein n=1 Tax=Pistacia integerrima TaxID=434235 RepID=A0ACC0YDZ6_9ROSI|nr:hypothetical protein Pint_25270 [Pistacia integerrima]
MTLTDLMNVLEALE